MGGFKSLKIWPSPRLIVTVISRHAVFSYRQPCYATCRPTLHFVRRSYRLTRSLCTSQLPFGGSAYMFISMFFGLIAFTVRLTCAVPISISRLAMRHKPYWSPTHKIVSPFTRNPRPRTILACQVPREPVLSTKSKGGAGRMGGGRKGTSTQALLDKGTTLHDLEFPAMSLPGTTPPRRWRL